MSVEKKIINIVIDVLQLDQSNYALDNSSLLLGAIPEFDSMAVISVITTLESEFDFFVEDDELDAEIFESVATLIEFVENKLESLK